jgi:hypothetical protein
VRGCEVRERQPALPLPSLTRNETTRTPTLLQKRVVDKSGVGNERTKRPFARLDVPMLHPR